MSYAAQDPADFYSFLVDSEVIQLPVTQTNRKAKQVFGKSDRKNHSRLKGWVDTDDAETRRFLGLLCSMGLVRMPPIDSYWKSKSLFKILLHHR